MLMFVYHFPEGLVRKFLPLGAFTIWNLKPPRQRWFTLKGIEQTIGFYLIGFRIEILSQSEYHLGSVADLLAATGADGMVLALGLQSGTDRPTQNWLSIAFS